MNIFPMFIQVFYSLCIVCLLLWYFTKSTLSVCNDVKFKALQRTYLIVYLLAMAGDWLQASHMYVLYETYGMTTYQIQVLFVAGFGSSMVLGTIVGSFADKYGRRNICFLYGVLYALSCVTKHFNNFVILLIGRLLGGVATSILFSAFESWLVCEHNKRGINLDFLRNIFSSATFGNSLVAIVAGLISQIVVNRFGLVAPFDVSLFFLICMCVVIVITWTENYGNSSVQIFQSFKDAWETIRQDSAIVYLGLVQSLFEGAMYTFVLEWTPALAPAYPPLQSLDIEAVNVNLNERRSIPHGYVFSSFMVAMMIGTTIFKLLSKFTSVESFMRVVLLVAAVSLEVPILLPGKQFPIFIAFLVFELCVGIFWPSMGTMRSRYIPETTRSTIMNFFRIPLNVLVVSILLMHLEMKVIFQCCVVFLLIACICQQFLYRIYRTMSPRSSEFQHKEDCSVSNEDNFQQLLEHEVQ